MGAWEGAGAILFPDDRLGVWVWSKGNILPLLTENVLGEPEPWGSHCWELGEVKSSA